MIQLWYHEAVTVIMSTEKSDVMNVKEHLTWILDKRNHKFQDDKYQENIDFVHSLGKKCDCVGWSELDMDEPDADEVLVKIQTFCKEQGFRARGWYERTYTGIESDWYELKPGSFQENTELDTFPVETQNGKKLYLSVISAYHEINIAPKDSHNVCVPDRFRKVCLNNGMTDVDFCWVQDKGRYEAEQYFYLFPHKRIPRIAYDRSIDKKQTSGLQALGGYLPKIASIFYDLQHISLQDCYLREDMPSGGIAYVYCPSTDDFCGRYTVLIHKDTAGILIKEKVLSRANLTPACVVEHCPEGYDLDKTEEAPVPLNEYMEKAFAEYKKLKAKGRPEYIVKDKDALRLFRKTKAERRSDFNKRLGKKCAESIADPVYTHILPYYQVADGGLLSDEYTFLSYADSLKRTKEFFADSEKEELLETKPDGVVIAACADGDVVLYTRNENVIRFGHEVPDIISEWRSMAEFFVEAMNDAE